MMQEHAYTKSMRQWLSNIEYLQKKKKKKTLLIESQLSDVYHPLERQKNNEVFFVTVGTGLALYAFYKYLRQMIDEKLSKVYYQPGHLWIGSKAITELHKITCLSNDQYQFDLLYVPHSVFEGNTHKHKSTYHINKCCCYIKIQGC